MIDPVSVMLWCAATMTVLLTCTLASGIVRKAVLKWKCQQTSLAGAIEQIDEMMDNLEEFEIIVTNKKGKKKL